MPKKIGVANTSPVYRVGLADALPAPEFEVEDASEPANWLAQNDTGALLLGVYEADDLELVVDLVGESAHRVVVTIVHDLDVERLKACLEAGAAGAIDMSATSAEVAVALEGALMGKTVVPTSLARGLTGGRQRWSPDTLSGEEIALLLGVVSGNTIHQLGLERGYSDREIHRRLQRIYRKMGVKGRVEAIVLAASSGLVSG